jgi:hypothetical protein
LGDEVMDINDKSFMTLEDDLSSDFKSVYTGIQNIKKKLKAYSDGKTLKGDEIVRWYGEICCRELTGGRLVPDKYEHDVETPEGHKISVKTRKGMGSGWNATSAIPKI